MAARAPSALGFAVDAAQSGGGSGLPVQRSFVCFRQLRTWLACSIGALPPVRSIDLGYLSLEDLACLFCFAFLAFPLPSRIVGNDVFAFLSLSGIAGNDLFESNWRGGYPCHAGRQLQSPGLAASRPDQRSRAAYRSGTTRLSSLTRYRGAPARIASAMKLGAKWP